MEIQTVNIEKRKKATGGERSSRSAQNRYAKGYKAFSLMLSPEIAQKFDALAEETGLKKKELIELFIEAQYKSMNRAA